MAKQSKFMWWMANLLHIETLFIIIVIFIVIYVIITKDTRIVQSGFAFSDSISLPPSLIEKKKPGKRVNKNEERCRKIFEDLFHTKFVSIRPPWLKNPATGRNLELDGYAPEIETPVGRGLAFEYDGEQHARMDGYYHTRPDEFVYQTKKDSWKDLKCKDKGVMLVRIPHYVATIDLERFITMKLRNSGVKI